MVATRWTGRGTHQGDLMGVQPSGKRVEVMGNNICRIEGKIVEEWDIYDALGMMQAIDAVPEQ
jgi:predicted ester cyclase